MLAFESASRTDQNAVLEFLKSLGGKEQVSLGLISPNARAPSAEELGGPSAELSQIEVEQWTTGRTLFDKNFGFTEGLGGQFNGDSCRACHFLGAVEVLVPSMLMSNT